MGEVKREIERRLVAEFRPARLVVTDDSDRHIGHAGHDPRGESHFTVEIVADAYAGLSKVQSHRAINRVLADLLADRVHALVIRAAASSPLPGRSGIG